MCREKVLVDHVDRHNEEGQSFAFMDFAGGGIKDSCPMCRPGANDLVRDSPIGDFFARKASERVFLKTELMFWKTGHDMVAKRPCLNWASKGDQAAANAANLCKVADPPTAYLNSCVLQHTCLKTRRFL